jgi:predicted AlkP superfamily pyrophosphatase or phosphodiesterase
MHNVVLIFALVVSVFTSKAQTENKNPKLIVGIVVDQMRADYLEKFYHVYSEQGFLKLKKEGLSHTNMHYTHIPTYTAPGHATLFTGKQPSEHGIVANNWYNTELGRTEYCVEDTTVLPVGSRSNKVKRSAKNLWQPTLGDYVERETKGRGRTIGLSLKDRGAILPIGKAGDLAVWFRGGKEGKWVSSSAYTRDLPLYISKMNMAMHDTNDVLNYKWELLHPSEVYGIKDDAEHEGGFNEGAKHTFPYKLQELSEKNGQYDLVKETPLGNTLLTDLAIKTIEEVKLGSDEYTDLLTISYSATDYVGHRFGIQSLEVVDCYARLDFDIARLLKYLEEKVGKENFILFVSSDHGAANTPNYAMDHKEGGYTDTHKIEQDLKDFCQKEFKTDSIIAGIYNQQVYLNLSEEVEQQEYIVSRLTIFLNSFKGTKNAYNLSVLDTISETNKEARLIANGYHKKRSGQIAYTAKFGFSNPSNLNGSTHGSGYSYDTHVPFLLYGYTTPKRELGKESEVIDILPTILKQAGFTNSMKSLKGSVLFAE